VKTNPTVFLANLHLSATNDDLIDMMRQMKAAREAGWDSVICSIDGFGDDPRELWQIVEVRAFCRRLVTLGFVSYLDVLAGMNPDPSTPNVIRMGFGAGEVWFISEGLDISAQMFTLTPEMIRELSRVMHAANKTSDAKLGKMKA